MVIVAFDGLSSSGKSDLARLVYENSANCVFFDTAYTRDFPVVRAIYSLGVSLHSSETISLDGAVELAAKGFPSLKPELLGALSYSKEFTGPSRVNAFFIYLSAVAKKAIGEMVKVDALSKDVVLDGWQVSDWAYRAAFDSLRWTDVMGFFEDKAILKPDVQFVVVKNTGKISDNTGREHINHIRFQEIHQYSIDEKLGFHWVNTEGPKSVTEDSEYYKKAKSVLLESGYRFKRKVQTSNQNV